MKRFFLISMLLMMIMAAILLNSNAIAEVYVGETIEYGSFQDSSVEWVVLDVGEDDSVLAVSKYILDYHDWYNRWSRTLNLELSSEDKSAWRSSSIRLLRQDEIVTYGLGLASPTSYAASQKRYNDGNDMRWWTEVEYTDDSWQAGWYSSHRNSFGCFVSDTGETIHWAPGYAINVDMGFRPAVVLMPRKPIDVKLMLNSYEYVQDLTYTFGSYSWNRDDDDFTSFIVQITKEKTDENVYIESVDLILPDGFSFEPDSIVKEKPVALSSYSSMLRGTIDVYPIYSPTYNPDIVFKVSDSDYGLKTFKYHVARNPEEGLIRMRPTTKVNQADTSPFWYQLEHFVPHADFFKDSGVYSQNLAEIACTLSQSVYGKNKQEDSGTYYADASIHNLGFSKIVWQNSEDNHDVASAFALKKVIYNGQIYYVVLTAVRGTVGYEWIGNFNVLNVNADSDVEHTDFRACADKLVHRLKTYIKVAGIPDNNIVNTKILFCGHSRAGAVVDLAAHDYNAILGQSNIYAYTFAAPNSTKAPVADANIINILYKYDFVGYIPLHYQKHGVTIVVGGDNWDDAPQEVKDAFSQFTLGNSYQHVGSDALIHTLVMIPDFIKNASNHLVTSLQTTLGHLVMLAPTDDNYISKAHGAENYCAWVIKNGIKSGQTLEYFVSSSMRNLRLYRESLSRLPFSAQAAVRFVASPTGAVITLRTLVAILAGVSFHYHLKYYDFHCPVDIDVRDANGNIIAAFANHVDQMEALDMGIIAYGDGDVSHVLIPEDIAHTVSITAISDGEMTINYRVIDITGDIIADYRFEDIPLQQGEVLTINSTNELLESPQMNSSLGTVYTANNYKGVLIIPDGIISIEDEAFAGLNIEKVVIPESCEYIGHRAFADNPSLKLIQFNGGGNVSVAADFLQGSPNATVSAPENSPMSSWR